MNTNSDYQQVLDTFKEHLLASGVPEQETGFILGRILRKIVEEVAEHIKNTVGEDVINTQQAEIARLFQEKAGQTIDSYRMQVVEKLLAEYEAA
ncbi:MAG: hypothetical protein GW947_02285 [Candidatus Pacebacteria bacterium]|nr:hypothetical protein [Candidatus Paceibacterota bacterium]PIR59767.1 MAG: hypothetical protein COU68_03785 [Candidatus Pacebacteria bacterium CG10_big_fil_rev_8_21_14_0_10_45_6]